MQSIRSNMSSRFHDVLASKRPFEWGWVNDGQMPGRAKIFKAICWRVFGEKVRLHEVRNELARIQPNSRAFLEFTFLLIQPDSREGSFKKVVSFCEASHADFSWADIRYNTLKRKQYVEALHAQFPERDSVPQTDLSLIPLVISERASHPILGVYVNEFMVERNTPMEKSERRQWETDQYIAFSRSYCEYEQKYIKAVVYDTEEEAVQILEEWDALYTEYLSSDAPKIPRNISDLSTGFVAPRKWASGTCQYLIGTAKKQLNEIREGWSSVSAKFNPKNLEGAEDLVGSIIERLKRGRLFADYYHGTNLGLLRHLAATEFMFLPFTTLTSDLGLDIFSGEQKLMSASANYIAVTKHFHHGREYAFSSFNAPISVSLRQAQAYLRSFRKQGENLNQIFRIATRYDSHLEWLTRLVDTLKNRPEVIEEYDNYAFPMILGFKDTVLRRQIDIRFGKSGERGIGKYIDLSEVSHIYVVSEQIDLARTLIEQLKVHVQARLALDPGDIRSHLLLDTIDNIELVSIEAIDLFFNELPVRRKKDVAKEWDRLAIEFLSMFAGGN